MRLCHTNKHADGINVDTSFIHSFIRSFNILSDDRSKASSKTIPPHSAF